MNLSRICLPVLVPMISARSFQFLPTFLINDNMVWSSYADHIFLCAPSCDNLRYRCKHWFSFRSCIIPAITPHLFGCSSYSRTNCSSSSGLHVLTFLFLVYACFCFISSRYWPLLFGGRGRRSSVSIFGVWILNFSLWKNLGISILYILLFNQSSIFQSIYVRYRLIFQWDCW